MSVNPLGKTATVGGRASDVLRGAVVAQPITAAIAAINTTHLMPCVTASMVDRRVAEMPWDQSPILGFRRPCYA